MIIRLVLPPKKICGIRLLKFHHHLATEKEGIATFGGRSFHLVGFSQIGRRSVTQIDDLRDRRFFLRRPTVLGMTIFQTAIRKIRKWVTRSLSEISRIPGTLTNQDFHGSWCMSGLFFEVTEGCFCSACCVENLESKATMMVNIRQLLQYIHRLQLRHGYCWYRMYEIDVLYFKFQGCNRHHSSISKKKPKDPGTSWER